VPFLLGFVMIAVALRVRLRVEESPVFQRVQASQKVVKLPIVDAIKSYPRSVLVGIGAHVCRLHVRDLHRRLRHRTSST
jgi:MFS transporter, MHS family, shikimate and dehydroshikimate transport protein